MSQKGQGIEWMKRVKKKRKGKGQRGKRKKV